MANKRKHMERSRRSYGNNKAILGEIRRKAVSRQYSKDFIKRKLGFMDFIKSKFRKQKVD